MKTLLLVEDNDVEREGLTTILRQGGYNVLATPSGDEALALAEQHQPDLILLDMIMRGTDGWRFLDKRKKHGKLTAIPVLIVTGIGIASDEWAKELGADGFLRKPVDTDNIFKKIQERTG